MALSIVFQPEEEDRGFITVLRLVEADGSPTGVEYWIEQDLPPVIEHEGFFYVPAGSSGSPSDDRRTHDYIYAEEPPNLGVEISWMAVSVIDDEGNEPTEAISDMSRHSNVLEASVSKADREQLIVEAFAGAYGISGASTRPGGDPPDVILDVDSVTHEIEVVQLTLMDTQLERAHLKEVERALSTLIEPAGAHAHHRGRIISIQLEQLPKRRDLTKVAESIADALLADHGVFTWDASTNGFPSTITGGPYPAPNGIHIIANQGTDVAADVQLQLRPQATVQRSQAVRLLNETVTKKDVPANSTLLISIEAPTSDGSVQHHDAALYQLLTRPPAVALDTVPKHLSAVFLHKWEDRDVITLHLDDRSSFFVPSKS